MVPESRSCTAVFLREIRIGAKLNWMVQQATALSFESEIGKLKASLAHKDTQESALQQQLSLLQVICLCHTLLVCPDTLTFI